MKFGSKERALATYSGILSLALVTAYLGGLVAREQNGEYRSHIDPADGTTVSDEAVFSRLILGGAASISQSRGR